jgi:dihydroxyacid dehydratase/phosphogluconate dehydratase
MARTAPSRLLRSQLWFDNPANPGMTALYLERYLNYGLTRAELSSGKPIVGIAQAGSDLLSGNLFTSAIMKASVISAEFRARDAHTIPRDNH